MEILGYLLAVVMGFTLGLLGGGGSILTVPILVYVLGVEPVLATAYSLFVVGSTAVIGGAQKHRQGLVRWKTGIVFAIPSLVAVLLTRLYLVPAIPETIFRLDGFSFTKDIAIMVFFGVVMLLASYSMIKDRKDTSEQKEKPFNFPLILAEGLIVGVITGLVGAGGGFLIVPALVLLVGLPIKEAVGTSLVIIAIKSLIGFLGDIGSGQDINWTFLLLFTACSFAGMFIGTYATRFVSADRLKKGFGWFVLAMGIFIILSETVFAV
ncbi:sulfite exporter TauE/SafE family protein [Roseivirga sp. BDSF3-8]|uniref:sulfite exporter TauE/SafE family protein n=1 Tax=Roseivirga sp. BDSF3-8 TaxID=3241598 RepID=UPI00353239A1